MVMALGRFYIFVILLVFTAICVSQSQVINRGTTRFIKDIFIGKCWEYQTTLNPPTAPNSFKDCTQLWELFFNAFGYKDACSVTKNDYAPFMNAANEPLPKDKAIFWAGTYILVHDYSARRRRVVPLAETLVGYMVNNLVWCGSRHAPGINYTYCPPSFSTDCGPQQKEYAESYWAPASVTYANAAHGKVQLLLNGTRGNRPAYENGSFFGQYELPNLHKDAVTQIQIMVAHDIGVTYQETCTNGTLPELQQEISAKEIPYSCTDDPLQIRHLLCVDAPESKECLFASSKVLTGINDINGINGIYGINGATRLSLSSLTLTSFFFIYFLSGALY